jgi:uncharacterized OsmC-like protein
MGVTMKLDYKGELRCELEHGPSKTVIATDAPLDNMGKGAAFSPTDLVGAALASCAVTTMAIKGSKEGIPFASAEAKIVKEMSSEGPRRIRKLELELTMPGGLQPAQRARLEEIARTCPVALSLSKELELPIVFRYPD